MALSNTGLSLTRRLIGQYLMFALAGLFVCITVMMYLAMHGSLLDASLFTIIAPLVLLGVGAVVLGRTARLNTLIEEQLHGAAFVSAPLEETLKTLPEASPIARAWNDLVQQIRNQQTLSSLESRLSNLGSTVELERWESLFNSLPDGIAITDRRRNITLANNSARALLRLPADQLPPAQNVLALLEAILPAESAQQLHQLASGPVAFSCELKKGAELAAGVWRISRAPLVDQSTDDSQSVWTIRDITQQKLAEEMRNQFVFTATHELRTPLANIRAYAELLATQDEIPLDQQKDFYNIINSEATRLGRFINDLLNISQMETGSFSIVRHETDVERLVEEIINHVSPQATQKQQRLDCHLPPKCPKIAVDKDKLSAALVNLLGNAIKYTPNEGRVHFRVEPDHNHIRFTVEDTGIGISPEELPRLFQKFFRSSDSRVREITGSGLGLAFSQEVARLHGGKLSVTSELNKGSLFTLTLPL
jgi:two-component system phosphate regulon sensor histidine kinase PhoR